MTNIIFACFPIYDIKLTEVILVSSAPLHKVSSGKNEKLGIKPHKSEIEELSVIPNSTQKRNLSKENTNTERQKYTQNLMERDQMLCQDRQGRSVLK
jgi:hypothetical protein